MSDKYIPYTYLIGWSKLNKYYYGVSYCNSKSRTANPNCLWKTYFTSSRNVKNFRKINGEPDIISIRKTFNNSNDAICWETKVLRRINAKDNIKFLNKSNGDKTFRGDNFGKDNPMYGRRHSIETRNKISKKAKGRIISIETRHKIAITSKNRKHSEETRRKISKGNKGKKLSEEQIKKISDAKKGKSYIERFGEARSLKIKEKMRISHKDLHFGENNGMYGKKHKEETKQKMSTAQKGLPKPLNIGKVICVDTYGNVLRVDKSVFDSDITLVGVSSKIGINRQKIGGKKF